jgi:hypothetical protein
MRIKERTAGSGYFKNLKERPSDCHERTSKEPSLHWFKV